MIIPSGWSQEELAEHARMHKNYIGGIERAERNPSLSHIGKLADAFGVTIPELFDFCKIGSITLEDPRP